MGSETDRFVKYQKYVLNLLIVLSVLTSSIFCSFRMALNLTKQETNVIDGLIILEEFSKEIAAITLVKYHHAC